MLPDMWYIVLLAAVHHISGQTCYQGWVRERDSCYRAIFTPLSWQHASTACVSMTAHLVTLNDLTEQTRILELRSENIEQLFWIGYHKQGHVWQWPAVKTSSLNQLDTSNKSYVGQCAAIDKKGAWLPVSCDRKLPFFCEVDAFDCPVGDGWMEVVSQCLFVVRSLQGWYDAWDNCHTLDAELANIHGYNEALLKHISVLNSANDLVWAGLGFDSTSGRFVWTGGSDSTIQLNVSANSTLRCGAVGLNSTKQLEIKNTSCSAKLVSICEKSLNQARIANTSPQTSTMLSTTTVSSPGNPSHGFSSEQQSSTTDQLHVTTTEMTMDDGTWLYQAFECFKGNNSATRDDCILAVLLSADPLFEGVTPPFRNRPMMLTSSEYEQLLKGVLKYADGIIGRHMATTTHSMDVASIADNVENMLGLFHGKFTPVVKLEIQEYNIAMTTMSLSQGLSLQSQTLPMPGCLVSNLSSRGLQGDSLVVTAILVTTSPYRVNFANSKRDVDYFVVSPILTLSAYSNDVITSLSNTFTMYHHQVGEMTKIYGHNISHYENICGYYIHEQRVWSDWGCDLLMAEEYTSTCHCNHTTSFAVLMKIKSYKTPHIHEVALSVITTIGCSISMLTMFIALTIFTCVRSLNSERVYVHRNLCLAILCAQVAFLAGIKATEHKLVCRVAAIVLHYCYLAVFTWMFVEGMHLYTKVVQVYTTEHSRTTYYLLFGWGIPLLLVTISAIADIEGYGSPTSCWLSVYRNTIWAFVGPAIAVITVNIGILGMVLKIVVSSTKLDQPRHVQQIRAGAKAAVVLLPLLGLTWLFGLLVINKDLVIFEYLFAFFNSLQGFFVFVFHCLLNTEVREALRRLRDQHVLQHEVSETSSSLSDTLDRPTITAPRATIQIRAGVKLYLPVNVEPSTSATCMKDGRAMNASKGPLTKRPNNQDKAATSDNSCTYANSLDPDEMPSNTTSLQDQDEMPSNIVYGQDPDEMPCSTVRLRDPDEMSCSTVRLQDPDEIPNNIVCLQDLDVNAR